ncbi:rho GTPase-activating protein 7-like isoform X2 [Actinia tenebrosa]|uniref:Rho GTPase-activating protein 7-like isoform X2 n=1 Tax=Actinia tenebrosa TaxID=6105 RepID=A0A6P8ICK9_ACTTE|nr:rho GTPase-activating protein 7-like isoform X2 [Actinia tenebrosa]
MLDLKRMEASTITESVSSPNIILGRKSSPPSPSPRFLMPVISPVDSDDEDSYEDMPTVTKYQSEGDIKKLSTLEREENSSRLQELEALEACYWLKAAGFPQYAQSYEEGRFPIDIAVVIKEHDFLDEDSLQSLYRRLQTLNHCSKMNLHIKHIDGYDSDEEDLITLSSRWKLQNKNRNWSRRKRPSSQLSGSESSNSASNSNSTNSLRHKSGSTDVLNERCIDSNVKQLSLHGVDKLSPKKSLSPLNLSLQEGIRSSLYDNMPSGISLSTPSISSVSNEHNQGSALRKSHKNHRTNFTTSDLDLAETGLSADELSDNEEYEKDDVPSELVNVKNSRITDLSENGTSDGLPKSHIQRTRWHSFERSTKPHIHVLSTKICKLSAGQLAVLRKYSLLKLTALMERYAHSNRGMWNWSFPQFLKKFKTPDYRDKKVFGVPMSVILQRSGQPLPKSILFAMNYLQRTGVEAVGIFRKSGGKSRIQNLKEMMETDQDLTDFEGMSPYDLADMLKEYFRDLPDPILTSKLAETFIAIYSHIPEELRLEALQGAVLLMPDENREALQTLLLFLNDIAANAPVNQMNEKNLGVCFAPSLFHLCGSKEDPSAPKRQKRTPMNKASKELTDNLAAHECLTQMIIEVDRIFTVPEDTLMKSRFSFIEQSQPAPLEKLGKNKANPSDDYNTYIESCITGLLKEAKDKFKGWVSHPWHENQVEVSYKKIRDGCPLRLWRGVVDVDAPPQHVLRRITEERHLWDEDLETWDVVEKISEDIDIFHYVTQSMILQPKRRHVVLRARRRNLEHGSCVLVCTSVSHPEAPLIQGVEATVLAQRYLIEPIGIGQSRLTHITRIDLRGRTPEYYNKIGPVVAASIMKIKESFPVGCDGPETKV